MAEAPIHRNRPLLKGLVILGLHIRLKGCVYRQHPYTVRHRNGPITILPMEVFTQGNFVADFLRLNLTFIHKNDKFAFRANLWGS